MQKFILSKNLKTLRQFKGMNQTEFANLFGINRSNIGSYEEARAEPKLQVLKKITTHFNFTIDQMISEELSVKDIAKIQFESAQNTDGEKTDKVEKKLNDIHQRLSAIEKSIKELSGEKKRVK